MTGDETALLALYNQHYPGLINYGTYLTRDRELLNDCFMNLLLALWEKRASLPLVENVRSYLLTSFRRNLLHELEARNRERRTNSEAEEQAAGNQLSFEERLVQSQADDELRQKISGALGKLSARQSEVIRLRFFEDLDYDEIAGRCGIAKRTAYNTVYDALKILKEELYRNKNSGFLHPFNAVIFLVLLQLSFEKNF